MIIQYHKPLLAECVQFNSLSFIRFYWCWTQSQTAWDATERLKTRKRHFSTNYFISPVPNAA